MTRGPLLTGLSPNLISFASATRRAAVGIRDERGGERVRCILVTWRIVPSSRDSCVRRSRSIRPLTAQPRAANDRLIGEQFRRLISMRRMLKSRPLFYLGIPLISDGRNHDLEVRTRQEIPDRQFRSEIDVHSTKGHTQRAGDSWESPARRRPVMGGLQRTVRSSGTNMKYASQTPARN